MSASPSLTVAVGVRVTESDLFTAENVIACGNGHKGKAGLYCSRCGSYIQDRKVKVPTPLLLSIRSEFGESEYYNLGTHEYDEAGLGLIPIGHDDMQNGRPPAHGWLVGYKFAAPFDKPGDHLICVSTPADIVTAIAQVASLAARLGLSGPMEFVAISSLEC